MTPISDAALAHLREVADRPDLAGTPYELLEPLGRGGMGKVYLVMDLELQRPVALKVLSDPEPDAAAAAQLLAEARVIAGLEHPGIVPVHDVGTLPDGRVFYTMKRVGGTRLDALPRDRPLAERLRIFERICEPVAFAHARGVVHRDLKPENVMVGSFGEVLVMDWGLAQRNAEAPDRSEVPAGGSEGAARWRVVGTPGYMAPEQARGETADQRSDVYSLGGILYFLLTGRGTATLSEDPTASRRSSDGAATAPVLPPRRIDPKIPRPLESIVLKAMAEAPSGRYSSVAELSADVARFLADGRADAHRESVLERVGRFVHRYRAPIGLLLAYLIMRAVLLFVPRD